MMGNGPPNGWVDRRTSEGWLAVLYKRYSDATSCLDAKKDIKATFCPELLDAFGCRRVPPKLLSILPQREVDRSGSPARQTTMQKHLPTRYTKLIGHMVDGSALSPHFGSAFVDFDNINSHSCEITASPSPLLS